MAYTGYKLTCSSQLGVLPSYTALGMASLLPHTKLEYTEKGSILVDGKPTDSFEQRHEILSAAGGMAIKAEQLLKMGKVEGRKIHSRPTVRLHLPQ